MSKDEKVKKKASPEEIRKALEEELRKSGIGDEIEIEFEEVADAEEPEPFDKKQM